MNIYINAISVQQIFHLKNFTIQISEKAPHLILTGKNGSGKTILLKAVSVFLDNIKNDQSLNFLNLEDQIINLKNLLQNEISEPKRNQYEYFLETASKQYNDVYGKVKLDIPAIFEISKQYQDGNFIFAFYGAMRDPKMHEPKNPTKPQINKRLPINHSSTDQFLNFLSDLKIQEALARNENQISAADNIKNWFVSFESLLGELYEDPRLQLEFNYKDYSFKIKTAGKSFKFTELSDGFVAAIDIIADLILKMQQGDTVTRAYSKPGIVLIDEIETHLHLSLQKNILKILTRVFPNVQFIVTTHSPFVLSSLENATAYDLEHKEAISDLSEYSYESLAEGYFGVHTESSYLGSKLEKLKSLLKKESLSVDEEKQKQNLIREFNSIPEVISPLYIGEFLQLMIKDRTK